jgi:preprotein translocase subunit SecB
VKPSPLHLSDYFISDLHFSANSGFDPKREALIDYDDFKIESQAKADAELLWHVTLKLQYRPAAESNVPYRFTVEIVGSFSVSDQFPLAKTERLVRTNAPSMLYGILREVIRDTTARGPYSAVILPSTSFYEPEPKQDPGPDLMKTEPTR